MSEKKWLCSVADVGQGKSICVDLDGKSIAVFHVENEFYAIENSCPHRGGPLSEGRIQNHTVSCPLHAWTFDLKTGQLVSNSGIKLNTYRLIIEDNSIYCFC